MQVAARSKAWVYDRSLVGIAGTNPAGSRNVSPLSLLVVQVEMSATGRSLVEGRLAVYVCVCVCVCVSMSVIRCNSNPLHLQ
jgi:hypothetical protein